MILVLVSIAAAVLAVAYQRLIKKRGWQDAVHRGVIAGIFTPLAIFFGAFIWSLFVG